MIEMTNVFAYVGPGAGLSMVGALLAVGGLLLFALLAPVIYALRWVRSMLLRDKTHQPAAVPTQPGRK